jgi:peptidoglycan hydrolase-like protein with peptidoglycan-binding domain
VTPAVSADQWVAEGGLDPEVDSLPQAPKRSVESQNTSLLLSQIRQWEQDTRPLNPKHVEALVESIAVLGYYKGATPCGCLEECDGDYGSQMEAAVKAFQPTEDLIADGVIGNLTWRALSSLAGQLSIV